MYTSFFVKDKEKHHELQYIAKKLNYNSFGDFVWDAIINYSKTKRKTVSGLGQWQDKLAEIPTDVFDIKGWSDYMETVDRGERRRIINLATKLISLADKRIMKK